MIREEYKQQVKLLLSVLPEIAKEDCFALHGGTAINLFVRNMPRLSVDVDLTYLPSEDFLSSQKNINAALLRISQDLNKVRAAMRIHHDSDNCKLLINNESVTVKVEVNLTARGSLHPPVKMTLCQKAQEEFDVYVEMKTLPQGLLFGSKICAALDRQHPRDLFDVQYLLNEEGISDEVKEGFLFYLISHSRPIHELLSPNWQDQSSAIESQFSGMTNNDFTYFDYQQVRERLLNALLSKLTEVDKRFLISVKNLEPDWSIYKFDMFPGIRWKLQNIEKLKKANPDKYKRMIEKLESVLSYINPKI
jgi:predicted nucleotidyltransferase component of viral defense system